MILLSASCFAKGVYETRSKRRSKRPAPAAAVAIKANLGLLAIAPLIKGSGVLEGLIVVFEVIGPVPLLLLPPSMLPLPNCA